MEDQPIQEEAPTRRPLGARLAEHRSLAITTTVFLATGILAFTLWNWAGPTGSTSLQWAPLPAMTLVFIGGGALGLAFLLGAILCGCLIRPARPIVRITGNVVLGLMVVAVGVVIAVASLMGLLFSGGEISARPVFGGSYYESNLGFPDPSYTYYESHGFFLMAREGISTGETRAAPDADESRGTPAPAPRAPRPDETPQTGHALQVETEGSDPPIESSQIAASGSADGLAYGVAEQGQGLGGRATYVAAVSDDGGATWERRGTVSADQSFYGYFVVDRAVQVVAFGSGSDAVAPPAYVSRDGGSTWTELRFPVPADMPPNAQFVDDVVRDGPALTVTVNYPTWVTARGAGTTFVSHDDGVTWTLASN